MGWEELREWKSGGKVEVGAAEVFRRCRLAYIHVQAVHSLCHAPYPEDEDHHRR